MEIKVKLEPSIEVDYQTFDLEDTDLTKEDWLALTEDDQKAVIFEICRDNIYGMITEITATELNK